MNDCLTRSLLLLYARHALTMNDSNAYSPTCIDILGLFDSHTVVKAGQRMPVCDCDAHWRALRKVHCMVSPAADDIAVCQRHTVDVGNAHKFPIYHMPNVLAIRSPIARTDRLNVHVVRTYGNLYLRADGQRRLLGQPAKRRIQAVCAHCGG